MRQTGLKEKTAVVHLGLKALTDLQSLPAIATASFSECLELIELRKLHGLGLGWNDVQFLGCALMENIPIWTNDKRFRDAADSLGYSLT